MKMNPKSVVPYNVGCRAKNNISSTHQKCSKSARFPYWWTAARNVPLIGNWSVAMHLSSSNGAEKHYAGLCVQRNASILFWSPCAAQRNSGTWIFKANISFRATDTRSFRSHIPSQEILELVITVVYFLLPDAISSQLTSRCTQRFRCCWKIQLRCVSTWG